MCYTLIFLNCRRSFSGRGGVRFRGLRVGENCPSQIMIILRTNTLGLRRLCNLGDTFVSKLCANLRSRVRRTFKYSRSLADCPWSQNSLHQHVPGHRTGFCCSRVEEYPSQGETQTNQTKVIHPCLSLTMPFMAPP